MELLTLDQKHKLRTTPQVYAHFKKVKGYYLNVAKRVLTAWAEMQEIDRVDFVALYIKKTDQDVFGLDGRGMSVDEICGLYARAVVGREHEDEKTVEEDVDAN